jgi:predicted PurR-regulated permease PerM
MREAFRDNQARPLLIALIIGGFLIYLLQPILMPFLTGALLAYLGDPLADRLEARGLNRTAAVSVVFTGLTLIGVGGLLLIIPMLSRQISHLHSNLPVMVEWLQNQALPWLEAELGIPATQLDFEIVREALAQHWQSTGSLAATIVARATSSGLAIVGALGNLALIPVVTFYLLRDWDVVIARIRDLLPRDKEPIISQLTGECDEVVAAFLRGQFLVMISLGTFYSAGLWLIGLNLALLVGFVAGLASVVPYLGVIVGVTAATIATVFQFDPFWVPLILVWAIYITGQLLEGFILTPWLVGDRIGLHPVAVIFAVLAGGRLFGFTGVLLALPVAAVVMVLLRHAHDRYLQSAFYSSDAWQQPQAGQLDDETETGGNR